MLTVKTVDRREFRISTSPGTCIGEIKRQLIEQHNLAESMAQLLLLEAGKLLKDDTKVDQLPATQTGFLVAMVQAEKRKKPRPRPQLTPTASEVPAPSDPGLKEVIEAQLAEKSELLLGIEGMDMKRFASRVEAHAHEALAVDTQDLFQSFLDDADKARCETAAMTIVENQESFVTSPPCGAAASACLAIEGSGGGGVCTMEEAATLPLGVSPENVAALSNLLQGKGTDVKDGDKDETGASTGSKP